MRTAPTPECPSDDTLRQLAAGLTSDELAPALTRHAATCDHCGPLLRTFTEDFSDDFTPEEQAALANLQSATAAWQKSTARQMLEAGGISAVSPEVGDSVISVAIGLDKRSSAERTRSSSSGRNPFFWKWILIPATAAVVAVAAITFPIYYARATPEKVEKLLAQGYTEQRTMEMRWPGAKWSHLNHIRAVEPRETNQPLLRAEELIIKNHFNTNANISWRRLQAEAELLDGNAEEAIEKLQAMLKQQPDSVPLLMDISIAYFQLAETGKDPNAYRTSLEFLTQVLNVEPGNTAARFNQALVFERLGETQNAVSAWKTLLTSESDPGWKEEAQRHLKMLEN